MRQVVIYPGENGYWVAECPSLPGCISQAETKQELISNIKEAIDGHPVWHYQTGTAQCQRVYGAAYIYSEA